MRLSSFFLIFAMAMAAQDSSQKLPSAADVVVKMIEHDNQRLAALHGYTAARRYVLDNPRHHKRAEMLVRVRCVEDGSKEFQTVSESGWGTARNHVFPKLLESESEASLPGVRERSRITPENYSFEMVGKEYINGRPAYIIAIAPKTPNKYLIEGRIWVDVDEYAIVRIEGKPAKSPSFWIKSVHFVHTYQKSGSFWFPASDHSVTDARILGATVKAGESIEISEYGRPVARIMPAVPTTGVPLLDRLIAQGRAIPAASPGPIPPTPPREDRDKGVSLSAALTQAREDERY